MASLSAFTDWLGDTDWIVGATFVMAFVTLLLALATISLARSTARMASSTEILLSIEAERRLEETTAVVHARGYSRAPQPQGVLIRNDGRSVARGIWVEAYIGGSEPARSDPIAALAGGETAVVYTGTACDPSDPPTPTEREWLKKAQRHLVRCHWVADGSAHETVGSWERISG